MNQQRQDRKKNDCDDQFFKRIDEPWEFLAEEETNTRQAHDPEDPSDHVELKEPDVVHLANSSHNRRKCANDRDESGDDDRFPTMLYIKILGTLQVLWVEQ